MRNSRTYTARHNSIVQRLLNAAQPKWNIFSCDTMIESTKPKPDILTTGDSAIVLDVSVVHENRPESFQTTRQLKKDKYAPVIRIFKKFFKNVQVDAIVVVGTGTRIMTMF